MIEFSQGKHYEIIFSNRTTSTVLYAVKKYDITNDVITYLNNRYGPATAATKPEEDNK
jgi:outer membrane protein